MQKKLMGLGGLLALLATLAVGCSEQGTPTALEQESRPQASHAIVTDAKVHVAERTTPLPRDITVRAKIGRDGGELKIKEAGLYVAIPLGALSEPTEIVLTARAGKAYVYDFGPSPLHFAQPVKVEIDLKDNTLYKDEASLSKLKGAFYPGDAVAELGVDGTVRVTELYPLDLDVKSSKVKFYVEHFSGYLLAMP